MCSYSLTNHQLAGHVLTSTQFSFIDQPCIFTIHSPPLQDYAVLLWNHDSHKMINQGAGQREACTPRLMVGYPSRKLAVEDRQFQRIFNRKCLGFPIAFGRVVDIISMS